MPTRAEPAPDDPAVGACAAAAVQPGRRRPALRLLRAAVWLTALALVLLALGRYALPPLARSQAQRIAGAELGRDVTIGGLAFTPWTLELELRDIVVATADGRGEQLRIGRLHVDAAIDSLWRLAPVVEALRIEAPRLSLTRLGSGRWDIDDILERLSRPAAEKPADGSVARFALHDVEIVGGSADLVDRPLGRTHRLRDLQLALPFLSSLAVDRDTKVEPRLSFNLDGSRFASTAVATPFRADGRAEASLTLQGLDARPFLGYLPDALPVRLRSARLSTDLKVAFVRSPRASLRISGSVEARDVAITDRQAAALLDVGSIELKIADLRPLERTAAFDRLVVTSPRLQARRGRDGRIDLLPAADAPAGAAPHPPAAAAAASGAPEAARTAGGWSVSLAELSVRAGRLDFRDEAVAPAAAAGLRQVSLDARALRWPVGGAPLAFDGRATVAGAGAAAGGRLKFSGRAGERSAHLSLSVAELPLSLARPWLRPYLEPVLDGRLSAELGAEWQRADGRDPAAGLKLSAKQLRLADLVLAPAATASAARGALASVEAIELADASVEPAARRVSMGRLAVRRPKLALERAADGRWNVERWLAGSAPPAAAASGAGLAAAADAPVRRTGVEPTAAAPRWHVALGSVSVEAGALQLRDGAARLPLTVGLGEIALRAGGLALDAAQPAPLAFSARVTASAGASAAVAPGGDAGGRIDFRGSVGPFAGGVPSAARGRLTVEKLSLAAFAPYLGGAINLAVERALAGLHGDVGYAAATGGPRLRFEGDATLDDVRAVAVALVPVRGAQKPAPRGGVGAAGPPVLRWKSLGVHGIDLALAPGTPLRLAVQESTLTDLYARVVIDEQGRINLQDLLRSPAPMAAPKQGGGSADGTAVTTAPPQPQPARDAAAAVIRLGPTAFVNGRLEFTDRFVRPNYSASLTRLNGRLGAFTSVPPPAGAPPQLADLELRGNAEGTASLEISGKVNPLAEPLALDIKARVRDLDLPPLSPYAVKYAGYGIERGKMSVDVAYLVTPGGRLTASNNIVLNQLVFGDKVDGAANSLPVKLAAALLADGDGVINLDLPVSGSINDPQFSIGSVVLKLIGNLVVKAVSSPFRLIAAAVQGGGGAAADADRVEFAPGSALLGASARQALDAIAQALAERPQLRLTVAGMSSLETEREAWKHDRLRRMVQAEQRRRAAAGSAVTPGGQDAAAGADIDAAEYPALLAAVYRRSDLAKPRNLLGTARPLPVPEMEALLLAGIAVDEEAMQRLAARRAAAVRDYLLGRQLPAERIFLGPAKVVAPGDSDRWTPHADLNLSLD